MHNANAITSITLSVIYVACLGAASYHQAPIRATTFERLTKARRFIRIALAAALLGVAVKTLDTSWFAISWGFNALLAGTNLILLGKSIRNRAAVEKRQAARLAREHGLPWMDEAS
jgi:hypothetical protein